MRDTLNANTEQWLNDSYRGGKNLSTRRKTCPRATSTTANSMWTAVGSSFLFSIAFRAALGPN